MLCCSLLGHMVSMVLSPCSVTYLVNVPSYVVSVLTLNLPLPLAAGDVKAHASCFEIFC